MAQFKRDTLEALRGQQEIAIRTGKHPSSPVTIWAVVADDEVFVRSVRGPKGRWYRDLAKGGPATLQVGGHDVPVEAVPATDSAAVERASRAYLRKYSASPYAESMVRPDTLPTTLRLEPR